MSSLSARLRRLGFAACPPPLARAIRRRVITRQVLSGRGFFEAELGVLDRILRRGDCAVDVGANVGFYTTKMARLVGEHGRVYAFEPLRGNLEILGDVVRRGSLRQVRVVHAAVGAEDGQCEVAIPSGEGFSGHYLAHVATGDSEGRRERVALVSLDSALEQERLEQLQLIKCDVEGGEVEVIRGAGRVCRDLRPGWLMEVSRSRSEQVFSLMHAKGYRCFVLGEKLEHTETYLDGQYSNYLFFHPESELWHRAVD
jgi:FkbM family methyltransferase